jgi:predicted SnoaL-like aldol condensation-catalyzing enzyme
MEHQKLNVLRQIIEQGFGNADVYVIDQLVADDYIEHQFNMRGGKEGLKRAILSLSNAFSNHEYELINHSVNGDIVWVHYLSTGEHTGPFVGHAPTGKKFSIDVIDVARIQNGKLVEHWGVPDRFALLMQLGFLQPTNVKP